MCQHDFRGRRLFQHRNSEKWDLSCNRRIPGFRLEEECLGYIGDLRRVWDGRISSPGARTVPGTGKKRIRRAVQIAATMISCRERDQLRRRTLKNLARTDWGDMPLHIHFDSTKDGTFLERQTKSSFLALRKSLDYRADYILFLEDDLDFNRHIRHNLACWDLLRRTDVTVAGLYNPRLREKALDVRGNTRIVDPGAAYGSQALLLAKDTVEYVVRRRDAVPGLQDLRIFQLAGRLGSPLLYHAPSLVQHIGVKSTWGGGFHRAFDFDPSWKA